MKFTILFIVCITLFHENSTAQNKSYYDSLQQIPPFTFYTLDGKPYSADNINEHITTVLIYFKTYCEFCQDEISSIRDNIDCFRNFQFLLLSNENDKEINAFVRTYHLNDYPQFVILQDRDKLYYNYYHSTLIPSIHIYYRKKLLLFSDGSLKIEDLEKYNQ